MRVPNPCRFMIYHSQRLILSFANRYLEQIIAKNLFLIKKRPNKELVIKVKYHIYPMNKKN